MSETVHLSNKSSGLLQASRNSAGANMSQYTYSMSKPSVNKFIDKWQKTTFQGADWGREVTASIPPYGLVKSMMVKFNISFTPQSVASSTNANVGTAATENVDKELASKNKLLFSRAMGAHVVSRAVLQSHSREIESLYPEVVQWKCYQKGRENSKRIRLMMYDDVPSGDKVTLKAASNIGSITHRQAHPVYTRPISFDVYMPLDFSFMSSDKCLINSRFQEKTEVLLNINPYTEIIAGTSTAFAAEGAPKLNSAELYTEIVSITPEDLKEIEKTNHSLTTPLSMLTTNWKRIPKTVEINGQITANTTFSSGARDVFATKTTMNIFQTELAAGLIVCVKQNRTPANLATIATAYNAGQPAAEPNTVGTGDLGGNNGQYQRILEVSLEAGGRTIFKSSGDECLLLASHFGNWYAESHQEVGLIADPTTFAHKDLIYAIPLGDDIREDTKIDGCVAFKNLNNLTLSVTFEHSNASAAGVNRSFDVLCYVKHFSSVSINSNDGRVSKSLST